MKIKLQNFKKIFILVLLQILITQNANSNTIENFNIIGNQRVSDQTIIMFSSLNVGDKINENQLNEALKKLYYTELSWIQKICERNFCDPEVIKHNLLKDDITIILKK